MTISFKNKGLYYKYNTINILLKKHDCNVHYCKKEEDNIIIDFKTDEDYLKALNEICIIPINHKKV